MSPLAVYKARPDNIKVNLLVYGKAGSGKTTLACTAQDHPELSPVLLLNFEGGTLSIVGRGDIDTVDIHSMHDLEETYRALVFNDPTYAAYQTIIIDSGSEMLALAQREAVEGSVRAGKFGKDRTVDEMVLQDYGLSGAKMKRLLRGFRELPRHVLMTGLPRFTYPQNGSEMSGTTPLEVAPNFTASLREPVMGFMDFVWYMYLKVDDATKVETRNVLTRDFGAFRAKTRGQYFAQAVGQVLQNPTMPAIYELLKRSEDPTTRAAVFAGLHAQVDNQPMPDAIPDASSEVVIVGQDHEDSAVTAEAEFRAPETVGVSG